VGACMNKQICCTVKAMSEQVRGEVLQSVGEAAIQRGIGEGGAILSRKFRAGVNECGEGITM
jgi:hypothetical protein